MFRKQSKPQSRIDSLIGSATRIEGKCSYGACESRRGSGERLRAPRSVPDDCGAEHAGSTAKRSRALAFAARSRRSMRAKLGCANAACAARTLQEPGNLLSWAVVEAAGHQAESEVKSRDQLHLEKCPL